MNVKALSSTLVILVSILAAPALAEDADEALGYWMTQSNKTIIELFKCGEGEQKVCGRVAWTKNPFHEDGRIKRDVNNPDEFLRTQPICGLTILGDLEYVGDKKWKRGKVYNPGDGRFYSAKARLRKDGSLAVRGYLAIGLFGKTETWHRPVGVEPVCSFNVSQVEDLPADEPVSQN